MICKVCYHVHGLMRCWSMLIRRDDKAIRWLASLKELDNGVNTMASENCIVSMVAREGVELVINRVEEGEMLVHDMKTSRILLRSLLG